MAQMQVTDTSSELSAFEKAPAEIRRKIYEQLLKAENVRQSPDPNMVRHYHFEAAILSVNKNLHNEAWPVLYWENNFVTVSCNWEHIHKMMTTYQVAAIAGTKPGLVATFKESILRLHVMLPGEDVSRAYGYEHHGKVVKSLLLVADELPRFVRMLRMVKATDPRAIHNYNFRVEVTSRGPPTLACQQKVLEPFRCLPGRKGLTIGGAVDLAYAQNLKSTMESNVYWARGTAWDIYYLAVSIWKVFDEAFRLGLWSTAWAQYRSCKRLLLLAYNQHPITGDSQDHDWEKTLEQFFSVLQTNITLIRLRQKDWVRVLKKTEKLDNADDEDDEYDEDDEDDKDDEDDEVESDMVKSRRHLYRAIALAATGDEHMAKTQLWLACGDDPDDELIRDFMDMTSARLEATSEAEKAAIDSIFSDESLSRLSEPLQLADPILNPSDDIAEERYLLRHFGYQGDYLPTIEDNSPVNFRKIAQLMQGMEKQKAKLPPGAPFSIEVGGHPCPLYVDSGPRRM